MTASTPILTMRRSPPNCRPLLDAAQTQVTQYGGKLRPNQPWRHFLKNDRRLVASISNWVASLADPVPFDYPFAAGMVATVNACGFAMLPGYLGSRDLATVPGTSTAPVGGGLAAIPSQVAWAVVVAAIVTSRFVLLFGSGRAVVSLRGWLLVTLMPWLGLAIGLAPVGLGIA